ncbi:HlyD family secretion protein [Halomonas daqiaonensis]|uniref:Multidrug resistance efflux pump n=1 Tax=Halomonas daqiaonensis TaxID=650850 RepID=A0A1H7LSC5_9GAMM|nr:HlyD family efflux transporter periplasmic adaptor subunit [Halomonas daqiaonensis]SEL01375.1 Multidrug resistance efflux pump [Halomonas daqiaonensis]
MRRISRPTRVDNLKSESRGKVKKQGRIGRSVYLFLVVIFLLYLFDIFFGDRIYMSADGMIMRSAFTVDRDFQAELVSLRVEEGQRVAKGDLLGKISSTRMLDDLYDKSMERLDLESRLSEIRIRKKNIDSQIPLAKENIEALQESFDAYSQLKSQGLSGRGNVTETGVELLEAKRELATLRSDRKVVEEEIPRLEIMLERSGDTLDRLRSIYNEGRVTAPFEGTVSRIHRNVGQALEVGGDILTIHHGRRYVLAYLPVGRLYNVKVSEPVTVRFGENLLPGRVENIYPLATELPEEFRRLFGAINRRQLVRIMLMDNAENFLKDEAPLFTPVTVSGDWDPVVLMLKFKDAVSRGVSVVSSFLHDAIFDGPPGDTAKKVSSQIDSMRISCDWELVNKVTINA